MTDEATIITNDMIQDCIGRSRLVIAPAKILETPCIDMKYTPLIKNLYDMMKDVMASHRGVGLAAPQVGLSINFIIVKINDEVIGMLNPDIMAFSKDSVYDGEGCLSVPGYNFQIPRHSDIWVNYIDVDGNHQSDKFTGLTARCIQHEVDHLNGITIIKSGKLNRNTRRAVEADLRKIKSQISKFN